MTRFDTVIASGEAAARAERDYTVKVDAAGLAPGTATATDSSPTA